MNRYFCSKKITHQLVLLFIVCAFSQSANVLADDDSNNIVTKVVSAPVVANGIIGGEPSEFHIWLNSPESPNFESNFDPEYFGHQIPADGKLVVQLGGTFQRNPVFTGNLLATFNTVLLVGHHFNPIVSSGGGVPAHHGNWGINDNGNLQFTISPLAGKGENGLEGERAKKIGIKSIHVRTDPRGGGSIEKTPYLNGPAGTVGTLAVTIYDKNDEVIEEGHGSIMFEASPGRQVFINNTAIASRFLARPTTQTSLIESADWQHVSPNAVLTKESRSPQGEGFFENGFYAPRFRIYEKQELQPDSFAPFDVVSGLSYVIDPDEPWHATLTENGLTIGSIIMDGPTADSRGTLLPATTAIEKSLGIPCMVGSEEGLYTIEVNLLDGNDAKVHIVVD